MPQQILVEDDTQPVLSDTLATAKDPTGGSVTLVVQQGGSTNLLVNDTGTITDTTTGQTVVEYQFSASQTANTGTHKYEWVVTYADGDAESFPKDGFFEVEFDAQLNRGGTVVTPSTSGRAGPIDVLLLNEQASTPGAPAVDDWGLYVDTDTTLRVLDENGDTHTALGEPVAEGNVTATGGAGEPGPAVDTLLTNVTTDAALPYTMAVYTAADPSFDADYAYNFDYSHVWNESESHVDIDLTVNWDTDPGASNDTTLRWEVIEL